MKQFNSILLFALLFVCSAVRAQENPLWLRYPSISPNGKTIAFSYRGDIFLVASEGGRARQLTTHSAYESMPIWSPDSKTIAYSSERDGANDLFIISVAGGTPTRLTSLTNGASPITFTPDGKNILYNSFVQPAEYYGQFPSSSGQVYSISVDGGRPTQFLSFDAFSIDFDKTGDKIVYHDRKGYEDNWRKHHTSSVCRDIWIHDLKTKEFKNLTKGQVEDRYPVISSDQKTVYFLSERFGDFNVCSISIDNPQDIKQLTSFEHHPVRFLTSSDKNLLCFAYDGEIYTMNPNARAHKVKITVNADNQEREVIKQTLTSGAEEMEVSPDGKEFALVVRGDVFVANSEFGTSKRITNTAAYEKNVGFSPDGRSLVYSSHRDGQWNLFIAKLKNDDDKSFAYAREIEEEQLTSGVSAQFQPAFSPDGKEIAFIEDRTTIKVINLKSKKIRTVLPAEYNYSYTDGDQGFEWSPDGRWILTSYFEKGGWMHPDVVIVKADGSGVKHNLTNSGYSDGNPRWAMDGKVVIWSSDRQGMRSHGSWGASRDVYGVFLDEETFDEFNMNKEELALSKELKELNAKKKDSKNEEDGKKEEKKVKNLPELKLNFDNLDDKIMRLTINTSNLGDAVLTKDGKKLFYLSTYESGYDLWVRDFKENSTKMLSKIGEGGRLVLSKDGKTLYIYSANGVSTVDQNTGRLKGLKYSVNLELKPKEERQAVFNYVWQQVHDKFYLPDFGGVDWAYYKDAYSRFLPYITNNYDFADLLGEMLGELNASHTGARYFGRVTRPAVASLGAFYDENYEEDGLKINEVINKGPLFATRKVEAGMVITAINNQKIEKGVDYYPLLEGQVGKRTLLTITDLKGKEMEVYVNPISYGTQRSLLYDRWCKQRVAIVDSISNGEVGYIHVEGMNSASFRKTFSELLGRYRNRKAIVIDTRFNGGGWLHEDLVHLLSGKKYAEFKPRGQFIGIDPFMQWTKPSAVLVCEGNYSNAHGFPWVYKELGLGKLIGMPVPGTMTAVWWDRMPIGITFGIPQVGMKDNQGRWLENLQLEPDIQVENTPESILQGRDLQLEAAVKELMK